MTGAKCPRPTLFRLLFLVECTSFIFTGMTGFFSSIGFHCLYQMRITIEAKDKQREQIQQSIHDAEPDQLDHPDTNEINDIYLPGILNSVCLSLFDILNTNVICTY